MAALAASIWQLRCHCPRAADGSSLQWAHRENDYLGQNPKELEKTAPVVDSELLVQAKSMASSSVSTAPALPDRRAIRWATTAIVVGMLAILYTGVLVEMYHRWLDEPGASHGILIPPLTAYLVWMERRSVLAIPVRPESRGIYLVAAGCFLYLLGRLGAEYFLTRSSLMILLAGFIWTFWGRARLSKLKFPLLMLSTMIPIPALIYQSLAGPLQLFASAVATNMAQALGVTVFRDGNVIQLAGASLGVAEACSGLHSLSALALGALLVGFLNLTRTSFRAILFFSAIPIAIAANVIRVCGTAVLADYRVELAMGFYHTFSGWLVFLVAFGFLWMFASGLRVLEGRLK